MHYRIEMPSDAGAAAILTDVLNTLEDAAEMRSDLVRLDRACCQPAKFVTLEGAPLPLEVSA